MGSEHSHHISTLDHLVEHLREVLSARSVLVCIGSELCGDDGAGPAIAKALAGRVPWSVYDAQTVPENFLMKIVGQRPAEVVIIDALHFDARPGEMELFASDAIAGQGPSTHGPAPIAFLDLLNMMHPCRRVVLGIQPASNAIGAGLSEPVQCAAALVVQALVEVGKQFGPGDEPARQRAIRDGDS